MTKFLRRCFLVSTITIPYGCYSMDNQRKALEECLKNAFNKSDLATVAELLQQQANPDCCVNDTNITLLGKAAQEGNLAAIELLLQYHADVNKPSGSSELVPLHYAVHAHSKEAVHMLLRAGALAEKRTIKGETPLHYAAIHNRPEIVALLMAYNAQADTKNYDEVTPVHYAQQAGYQDIVQLLMPFNKTPELSQADQSLRTRLFGKLQPKRLGLHQIVRQGNLQAVAAALAHTIDVDERDNQGQTPLHIAAQGNAAQGNNDAIVKVLLERGADPTLVDSNGSTPLHHATIQGRPELVEILLAHPGVAATINFSNKSRSTPLMLAVVYEHVQIVTLLLDALPTDQCAQVLGPLFNFVIIKQNVQLVQMFLERGVSVNRTNPQGRTPLILAADHGYEDIVRLLLTYKPTINSTDQSGKSALDYATDGEHYAIRELLVAHGATTHSL